MFGFVVDFTPAPPSSGFCDSDSSFALAATTDGFVSTSNLESGCRPLLSVDFLPITSNFKPGFVPPLRFDCFVSGAGSESRTFFPNLFEILVNFVVIGGIWSDWFKLAIVNFWAGFFFNPLGLVND